MGVVVLNWWVWSLKVGMATKFFMRALHTHLKHPLCKFLDTPMKLHEWCRNGWTNDCQSISSCIFYIAKVKFISKPWHQIFMFGATVCCSGTNCGPIVPNQHPWVVCSLYYSCSSSHYHLLLRLQMPWVVVTPYIIEELTYTGLEMDKWINFTKRSHEYLLTICWYGNRSEGTKILQNSPKTAKTLHFFSFMTKIDDNSPSHATLLALYLAFVWKEWYGKSPLKAREGDKFQCFHQS